MDLKPQASDQIRELRNSTGMTQDQFAEAVGADQGQVSRWESGVAMPSVEAWIKLGSLAARVHPGEALRFWDRTGIDLRAILPFAESIFRKRVPDRKGLEDDGTVVLVPRYSNGESESHDAPPLPLPGYIVQTIASTYYLVADSAGNGFAAGDRLVFDDTAARTRKFTLFDGKDVLVNFTGRAPKGLQSSGPHGPEPVTWPRGLFVGTLGHRKLAGITEIVLAPRDVPRHNWSTRNVVLLDALTHPKHWDAHAIVVRIRKHYLDFQDRVASEHADLLSNLELLEGCEILGRFIALFNGRLD
jgi:transcriptional regulator with XRE-family HTH domain